MDLDPTQLALSPVGGSGAELELKVGSREGAMLAQPIVSGQAEIGVHRLRIALGLLSRPWRRRCPRRTGRRRG
jgi:hypothetical protein